MHQESKHHLLVVLPAIGAAEPPFMGTVPELALFWEKGW
jgi:hypothetical protein